MLKGGVFLDVNLNADVISSIIAAVVTYYIASKNIFSNIKIKIANDQLYNVYLPLFKFLEPHLYKDVTLDTINEFLKLFNHIKDKHYELIDSNLLNNIQILERSINGYKYSYEAYDYMCTSLDKNFEKTRKFLKLPTRNFDYKANNNQFNKSTNEIFDYIKRMILEMLPILLVSVIFIIAKLIFDNILLLIR